MRVVKRSGEMEELSVGKTKAAILRVGVPEDEADDMLAKLMPEFYDGITTEEIYRRVRAMLDRRSAARYGLKKALLALGPEGHNFETLVGRMFDSMGYRTTVRETVQGRCVMHEIDVMMEKDGERFMVECKFHNSLSLKCSIQTALYTYGRFLDVDGTQNLRRAFLVTNTRFTSDVERYAQCVGMNLIGWKYPEKGSLEDLLEMHRLFPLTTLELRRAEIGPLLAHDIVTVVDVIQRREDVMNILGREEGSRVIRAAESLG